MFTCTDTHQCKYVNTEIITSVQTCVDSASNTDLDKLESAINISGEINKCEQWKKEKHLQVLSIKWHKVLGKSPILAFHIICDQFCVKSNYYWIQYVLGEIKGETETECIWGLGGGESAVYSIFEYGLTEQCPENEVLTCVRTTGDCPWKTHSHLLAILWAGA